MEKQIKKEISLKEKIKEFIIGKKNLWIIIVFSLFMMHNCSQNKRMDKIQTNITELQIISDSTISNLNKTNTNLNRLNIEIELAIELMNEKIENKKKNNTIEKQNKEIEKQKQEIKKLKEYNN
jgi:TolA-binding protein